MSDNNGTVDLKNELSLIIKKRETPDLAQWSVEKKEALLTLATSKHCAQFLHVLIKKNNQNITLEQLEQVVYQSIILSNNTIIHKLIDAVAYKKKESLVKKAIERMLFLDKAEMLYKILSQYPSIIKQPSSPCFSHISQILGTFCFTKHIAGLNFILKRHVSNDDINFYCRRAAKDNEPMIVESLISGYAQTLEPTTQGVVLINLAHFGQSQTLTLFFSKTKFNNSDYLERALVKAVRQGHLAIVEQILSQPIEWIEALIERALDTALIYKQDDCLLKIIELKCSMLSNEALQNVVLDAYTNNCTKTVDFVLDNYAHRIWNKTKGEMLLLTTKNNDRARIEKLISISSKSKLKALYKQQAFYIAKQANNHDLKSHFETTYPEATRRLEAKELEEGSKLTLEINQALTFQFSRLRVSKKELVGEDIQTKKPTKCVVLH